MDREEGNASEGRFQVLLAYLAANTVELRQLQCPDIATLLRTGEARRGKPAIPERAALHRFVQRHGHTFTDGQQAELRAWEARLCVSPEHAADAAQFAEFTALLERRADFFQSLRKPSLEACFEVHAVKKDRDLKFGQNFMRRSIPKLSQEQKDELAEWEAMLCDAGEGERLAFRPALQRQLEKFIALLENRAEYLQSLQKPSLKALFEAHTVKNDKELKFGQNFMCRCYPKLSQEQKDELAEWEAMLCDAGEGERLAFRPALQRQLEKFIALLENRAEYLQSLQKPSLKALFEAHTVKNDKELKFGQNFMCRCYPKLSQEQKDELAEWEAMLCDAGEGERLAFRPALQRQLEKFIALLENRAEYLQSLQKPSLKALFEAHTVKNDKELKFGQNFMCRCYPKLSQEQKDELAEWEAMLCDAGEGERLAFRPALQRQLEKFIALLENRAEYLQSLQKPSLKSLFEVHAAKTDKELKFCQHFMDRCYPQLLQEQKDELAEWEAMLCEPGEGERLAFRPALQRQLEKFIALLEDRAEYFQSLQKPSLKSLFEAHAVKNEKELKFGQNFMLRCYPKLSQGQKDELAEWEAMLCEPGEGERLAFRPALQRQVDRFVALLASRRAEFLQEKESSLGALFRAARRGRDKDWRFGHEFVSRVLPKLSAEMAAQVQQAAASCLCPAERAARKAPHEPKLHVEECALGDDLPRPRLPKCLRQFYGDSLDAETRVRTFFHRVHEVDTFLQEQEFTACEYCKEGWFGTTRPRDALPGQVETATFKKSNFILAPEKDWLEPGKAICRNCLSEAVARAKEGLPKAPVRFTAENLADPGESLAETDALTFFEEELLSPIQHIVRIFTLHATGQCELRGHVGNLFQNGPQYVRQIPALVGDMKMLLVRRCPKDPARKQRVPFLASRQRLEQALDRIARPAAEGGSLALQPGALTPGGYVDLVSRENLAQFEDSPEGAEPVGLQVTVVEQQEVTSLGYSLFAMWLSSSLELQLAAQVRALHEPADVEDQLQRQQATWNALRRAVRSFVFDEELDSTTAAAAPQTGDPGDRRLAASGSRPDVTPRQDSEERNVASDGLGDGGLAAAGGLPTAAPRRDLLIADLVMYLRSVVVRSGEFSVEEVLLDELTAVQELASWQEPLTSVGLWSPEDLAGQQTETTMKDDLWQALESANASAPQMRTAARFGAARIPGLPILDPPTVQSRNQLIREDQPYYIAAGFIKLFPLGQGDYWAHVRARQQAGVPLSFWEWLQHLLLHADGRFQAHPRFYFFALNTALRSKALRSRSYFVKRQTGMNANVPHTNEELLRMGKAQFTKIVTAFEHSLPCSAQEKIHQRSDLEAMVEQIEQDTFEFQVQELEETAQTAAQACGAGDQPHTAAAGELRQSLLDCQRFLDTMKVPGQASAAPDASPLLVSEGVGRQLSAGREDTGLAASGGPARDLGESPLLASEGVDRKQTAVRADTGLAASGGPAHDVRELAERLQVLLSLYDLNDSHLSLARLACVLEEIRRCGHPASARTRRPGRAGHGSAS